MAISISRWTITSRRSHGVRLLIEVHSVAAGALRVYNTRRVTEEMQAAFTIKFVQLGAALLWLATDWTTAQDQDLVRSCAAYKKSVFEETSEFSLLYLNAPIIYKTRDTCSSYTPLIIGGGPALPKEFPHAARLGNRNEDNEIDWFCGGTLISNLHVLTAAHCLYSENGAVNVVRLGELEFDNDKDDADPEDFGVANSTVHPGYAHPIIYNDIALLRLSRPVTFNEYKHPACLPFHDGSSDQTFIAIGWGQVKVVSESSKKLRKVRLNNYGTRCSTTSEPNEELPNGYNGTTQICIGSKEHKDTCNGDSGGPVLTYHKDFPCMYHVMGITSTGNFCDTPDFPGLYTRVHQYLDWIKAEMAKTS